MIPLKILKQLKKNFILSHQSLCVVESLTGGLLSSWLTHLPDSSKFFKGALTAYSTDFKIANLDLDAKKVLKEGLVTQICAEKMAQSVRLFFQSDWSLATTGVAGPAKGSLGEPVGKVAFSIDSKYRKKSLIKYFKGPKREDIRCQASLFALDFLLFELNCYMDKN